MSSFFEPAAADLWSQIQQHLENRKVRAEQAEDFPEDLAAYDFKLPLVQKDMSRAVGQDMARAWLRKHQAPANLEALKQELLGEKPAWAERMIVAYRCKRAMESMEGRDFAWRELRKKERPHDGQFVLYFFDVVGSHPGYFAQDGKSELFCNLFGGWLGGEEVTLWMPMPGVEDDIFFEIENQA